MTTGASVGSRTHVRLLPFLFTLLMLAAPAEAQMIDDGIMLGKQDLYVGDLYTHDSWDEYWEGALKRDNGNIGTVTTQSNSIFVNYGVSDSLNVITTLPYVWTDASQGVLRGQRGFQDITMAAKYRVLRTPLTRHGTLSAMGLVSGGLPTTDYTPDFLPLSIGLASRRVSGRFTLNWQSNPGWFVNGTTAYTWRGDVTLDRPFYYTDGRLFPTDTVDMPNVFDYTVSAGYMKRGLMAQAFYADQRTRGGGDIRRQDMPFVSNRMDFSKVGGSLMSPLPRLRNLRVHVAYSYTLDGRNVGQATSVTTGLLYLFNFSGRPTE